MEKAAFSLNGFVFNKVLIDLDNHETGELEISFQPKGCFYKDDSTFDLDILFKAFSKDNEENPFVQINCIGNFSFTNVNSFEEIPDYFYKNSVAILYPFIRSYLCTITTQATVPGLLLPVMNLLSLESPLKENTIQK